MGQIINEVGHSVVETAALNTVNNSQNSAPVCYNWEYRHGVDEKRRLQIPAKWRLPEDAGELTLILWPHPAGPCVRGLPPHRLAKLMADLDAMPNDNLQKVILLRNIGRNSVQVPVDKAGRVCIPESMAEKAGIQDEAVLVGLLHMFEVWSPDRYAKVSNADEVMAPEAFRLVG